MASTGEGEGDYWPGYVDALTAMVKVLSFIMMMLALAVFVTSQNVSKVMVESIAEAAKVEVAPGQSVDKTAKDVLDKLKKSDTQKEDKDKSTDDLAKEATKAESKALEQVKSLQQQVKELSQKVSEAETQKSEIEKKAVQIIQSQSLSPSQQVKEALKQAAEAQKESKESKAESKEAKAESKEAKAQAESAKAEAAQAKSEAAQAKTETAAAKAAAAQDKQMKEVQDSKSEAKAQSQDTANAKKVIEEQAKLIEQQKQEQDKMQAQLDEAKKQLAMVTEMAAPGMVPGGSVNNLNSSAAQINAIAQDQLVKVDKPEASDNNAEFVLTFGERSANLDDAAKVEIGKYSKTMESAKWLELRGYADASVGSLSDSRRVAFYRAMQVRNEMVRAGMKPEKVRIRVIDVMSVEEGRKIKIAGQK